MSSSSSLIQYSKKGSPYVKTFAKSQDDVASETISNSADYIAPSTEHCAVHGCNNTFTTLPPKIFVPVPSHPQELRNQWLEAIGFVPQQSPSHELFCCEDHFDLKKDVLNLARLRNINSGIVRDLLKDNVVPNHFLSNKQFTSSQTEDNESKESEDSSTTTEPAFPRIRVKTAAELMTSATVLRKSRVSVIKGPTAESSSFFNSSDLLSKLLKTSQTSIPAVPNHNKYRECAVPKCLNNVRTFPDIPLICAPIQEDSRRRWYNAIGRKFVRQQSTKENIYICAVHFQEDELESFRVPLSRHNNSSGIICYQKRAKHGVVPSLKLGNSSSDEPQSSFLTLGTNSSRVPDVSAHVMTTPLPITLQASSIGTSSRRISREPNTAGSMMISSDKYVPEALTVLPNCQHDPTEGYSCLRITPTDYCTFHARFYSLNNKEEQNEFIFSHTQMFQRPNSSQFQAAYKFFIDRATANNIAERVQVCVHAFAYSLSLGVTTLFSLLGHNSNSAVHEIASTELVTQQPAAQEPRRENVKDLVLPEPIVIDDDSPDEPPDSREEVERKLERVHLCERCLSQFTSEPEFNNHVALKSCTEHTGGPCSCQTCFMSFANAATLKTHTAEFHRYVCPSCHVTFRYRRFLDGHVLKCVNSKSTSVGTLVGDLEVTEPMKENGANFEWNSSEKGEDEVRSVSPGTSSRLMVVLQESDGDDEFVVINEDGDSREALPFDISGESRDEIVDVGSPSAGRSEDDRVRVDGKSSTNRNGTSRRLGRPKKRSHETTNKRKRSCVKPSVPTRRSLRTKKPIDFKDSDSLHGSDTRSETEGAISDGSEDPDYNPNQPASPPPKPRKRSKATVGSNSESDSSDGSEPNPKKKTPAPKYNENIVVNCGTCDSVFANVGGLRVHHKISERCGKYPPGTVFTCGACDKTFMTQTYLDVHRAVNEKCAKAKLPLPRPSEEKPVAETTVAPTLKWKDRSGKEPHVCKSCNVRFNSTLGLGLHLKRSQKCVVENPEIDIPGVVNRNELIEKKVVPRVNTPVPGEKETKEETVFLCQKCFSFFSSVWGLRTHERNSEGCKPDQPFEIPVPVPKENAEKLKREYQLKKGIVPGEPLRMPVLSPSLDEKNVCRSCSAVFTSVWGLRTHYRMSLCGTNLAGKANSTSQEQPITSEPTNICPKCSAKFSTPWGLRTHLRNSKTCCVNEVDKNMETENASQQPSTTGDLPFPCVKCERKFGTKNDLQDHIKFNRSCLPEDATVTTTGRVKPGAGSFLCPQCPKNFKLPSSLEQHFIEHAAHEGDYFCSKCPKSFSDQYFLHRHFHREHMGQWFCVICDAEKPTTKLSSFKEFFTHIFDSHRIVQDSENSFFRCMTCYRSFVSKYSLDHHVDVCRKLANQKFACASCYKIFTKKIHITSHMKYAHNGAVVDDRYNFQCPNCPRKFLSEEEYVMQHEKSGCNNRECPCPNCGELYIGADKLQVHIELCHSLSNNKSRPKRGRPRKTPTETSAVTSSTETSSETDSICDPYIEVVDVSNIKMEPHDVS